MEKDFKKLLGLLNILPTDDLFIFKNGKLKPYSNLYEFEYHLSNFVDKVTEEASCTKDVRKRNEIIEISENFLRKISDNISFQQDFKKLERKIKPASRRFPRNPRN